MPVRRRIALRVALTLPSLLACTGGCIDLARLPGDAAPRPHASYDVAPDIRVASPMRALPPELLAAIIAAIRG